MHNIGNCYAYGKGVAQNQRKAFLYYEAAAEAGDPFGKLTLGTWIYAGRGREGQPDRLRGFQLQHEAAEAGHPAAMFNVGAMYMSGEVGEEVPRDLEAARLWFSRAAEAGVVEGAVNVGNMYREGLGVEKDLAKAREMFDKFADRNEVCKQLLMDVEKQLEAGEGGKS